MKNNIKKVLYIGAFILGDIGIFAALVICAYNIKGYKTDISIEETTKAMYELTTESTTLSETRAIDSESSSPLVNWMRKKVKTAREKHS